LSRHSFYQIPWHRAHALINDDIPYDHPAYIAAGKKQWGYHFWSRVLLGGPQPMRVSRTSLGGWVLRESCYEEIMDCLGPGPSAAHIANVTISGYRMSYFYPRIWRAHNQEPRTLVVGVVSNMETYERRELIRSTWGESQTLVFVVAAQEEAQWEAEMERHNDLLVLVSSEGKGSRSKFFAPAKTQVLFHALAAHAGKYEYVVKVGDDSFLNPLRLARVIQRQKPGYWGAVVKNTIVDRDFRNSTYVRRSQYAPKYFPAYCHGAGYVLSKPLVDCVASNLALASYNPLEDVAIGMLAQHCQVHATDGEGIYVGGERGPPDRIIVQKGVFGENMKRLWLRVTGKLHARTR
jgi:hypothetical protein